jgi:hypothetical protein
MPYSDTGLTGTYSDTGLLGEAPKITSDLVAPPSPSGIEPAVLHSEPVPFTTHTEGDLAFLKDKQGRVVQVPLELADRYANEQGYQPVDAIEVAKAKKEAPNAFFAAAKEYYAKLASAAAFGVRAPVTSFDAIESMLPEEAKGAMYAVNPLLAVMGPQERQEFLRATSPTGVKQSFAAAEQAAVDMLHGNHSADRMASAYYAAAEQERKEHEAFPTLMAIVGGYGQVVGGAPYSAMSPAGGVLKTAAAGAAEAGLFGGLTEYDQAALDGRPVNVENVINSGLISAALGGVIGGAAAGTSKMFRSMTKSVDDWSLAAEEAAAKTRMADARKAMAEATDDGSKFAAKTEIEAAEFDAKVVEVMKNAGPNPIRQKEAAEKFVLDQLTEVKNTLGELHPDDWRRMAHPDMAGSKVALHAENASAGARKTVTEEMNAFLDSTKELIDPLRSAKQKKEFIEANFAADGDSIPNVFDSVNALVKRADDTIKASREELGALRLMKTDAAKTTLAQMDWAVRTARDELTLARSPAEAYQAADRLRAILRDKQEFLSSSWAKSTGAKVSEREAVGILKDRTLKAYQELAESLGDVSLFGKQGAAQKLVNGPGTGFVDLINSDRYALRHFVEATERDITGREVFKATEGKIDNYLKNLLEPGSRNAEFHSVVQTRINFLESVKKGYTEMTPATVKKIDEAIAQGKKLLEDVDLAERIAIKQNRFKRMLETEAARGGMLPSRFIMSALMSATGGGAGVAFAAAYNLPAFYRAASALSSAGPRGAVAELMGGPEQLVRWAHGIRLRNQAGKHNLMLKAADMLDWLSTGKSGNRVKTPGTGSFRKKVDGALGKIAKTAETAAKYSPPLWAVHDESEKKRIKKDVAKKTQALGQLARNPTQLGDTPLSTMAYVSPDLYRATSDEIVRRINVVQQFLPGQTRTTILGSQEQMSAQELRTAEMLLRVFEDPMSIIGDWQRGYLNPDAVEAAHIVAPRTFEMLRAAFIDLATAPDNEFKPSMNQLRQIDSLLGFNGTLDGSLEDAKLAAQVAQEQQQAEQGGGGGGRGPTKMVSASVAQNAQTFSAQVSQGITGGE